MIAPLALLIDETENSLSLAGLSIVAERPEHDESETLEDSLEDEESEESDEDEDEDCDTSRDTLPVGMSFARNW